MACVALVMALGGCRTRLVDEASTGALPTGDAGTTPAMRCAFSEPTVLVASAGFEVVSLALDSDSLYWGSGVTIRSVPKRGGAPRVIAQSAGGVQTIVESQGRLFWTTFGDSIGTVPSSGGSAT